MSSVAHKIKRKKSNARDFHITASVSLLTIECQPDGWHPDKLIILWGKENNSCQTKPVPWQPGIVNPYRGVHVWPEPDPVRNTFTMFKNPKRAGTYEDRPWKIVVKNECENGRRQVIATGYIDIADCISKTNKTFDITVKLKPALKKVLSGTIEFNFTSVMLKDDIPYRSDEEIFREIMADAIRSAKQSKAKTASDSGELTDPFLSSSIDKTLPSEIPPAKRKRKNKRRTQDGTDNKLGSGNTNNDMTAKVEKERSSSLRPPVPPNCFKTPASVTRADDNNNNLKAVTRSADEGSDAEQGLSNADSLPSANREGKKRRRKPKSPKDFTPDATFSPAERSVSSKGVLPTKTETTEKSDQETRKNSAPDQSEEKASLEEVPSIPSYRRRLRGFIKGKRHTKANEKVVTTPSSKEELKKESTSGKTDLEMSGAKIKDSTADNAPTINDGSSGCVEKVDMPHSSGTSGQFTALVKEISGERKDNTSAASEENKEKIFSFFKKLLENGPKKASLNCPELSNYASEEMKSVQEEIASLRKVTVKLETEMRQAMEIKECKEELDGLKQHWMILLSHTDELKKRKADLQILEKQEDLELCCDILRNEIKFVFTLKDWRRTDHHTLQESKLLDMLHALKTNNEKIAEQRKTW